MSKNLVAIVKYEKPVESVKKAIELSGGLDHLPRGAKVLIKPNLVFWTKTVEFPKWGVLTTSRIVEDMVIALKERGVDDITIAEGGVTMPKDYETYQDAFEKLGYNTLRQRYGVKPVNFFEKPYQEVDLGNGDTLNFSTEIMNTDFVVNVPVLKTHAQTVTSLGIKNLKGSIDLASRKKCHGPDPVKNLNYFVSRLADKMPPMFTLLDGIYTNERGPSFDGRMRRSNLLVASADVLSVDLVGTKVLGYEPEEVPHLVLAAENRSRPLDLSDVEVVGEKIEDVAARHEWYFPYTEDESLPMPMAKMGISGLSYRKYDLTMCTYCSGLNAAILTSIAMAYKGEPFDDVEILTGKIMEPSPGKKKTILLGQCMYKANKDHPNINELIAIKSCPPQPKSVVEALYKAGIEVNPDIITQYRDLPGFFMNRYKDKPEFEAAHFTVS